MKKLLYASTLLLGLAFTSCDKKGATPDNPTPEPTATVGKVVFEMKNMVGFEDVVLNNADTYQLRNGNTFSLFMYKYYLSNFTLIDVNGNEYTIPESYVLVDEDNPSSKIFEFDSIPKGNYVGVKILMGIDSARNVSGAQTGALDPIHGMFWTWNSGYIMAKVEGKSAQSGSPFNGITFHLGGFSGTYSSLRTANLQFNGILKVEGNNQPKITLKSDVAKWFDGENSVDFGTLYNVMDPSANSAKIADNYKNSLSVLSIAN